MSHRTITAQLPDEPPADSVILVEVVDRLHVGNTAATERRAFQRLDDEWFVVGATDAWRPGLSWAEVLAHAGGRLILVLWEPDGSVPS